MTTVTTYSSEYDLNQFWYDEAGSLNEAISDFMSLMFTESFLPVSFASHFVQPLVLKSS